MLAVSSRIIVSLLWLTGCSFGATFGTVVPLHGTVSDIALDERLGRVYAANFSASRIEVIDISSRGLLGPMSVPLPPSAVAISPDYRFLVVGEYQAVSGAPGGGYTVFDLVAGTQQDFPLSTSVLAVAFGGDGKALIVTDQPTPLPKSGPITNVFVLDPASGSLQGLSVQSLQSDGLPVSLDMFPAQIIQAATGVSGDRNVILVLATPGSGGGGSNLSVLLRYDVPTQTLTAFGFTSSPPFGPRSVSVDQTGANVIDAWALLRLFDSYRSLAQFPQPKGDFNIGTHAWDLRRNLLYGQIPAPGDGPVLHIFETDNLTVRERLQLRENLAGKSVMSSDMNTMYSASVSGVTILPVGQLTQVPQVAAAQEDILFQGDACNAGVITRNLDIVSLGSTAADFTLSLPQGVTGISLSATSGTTPATIQVRVDPAAFQGSKGTSQVMLTITSSAAVNLPAAVRLLINTKDFNQRGQIVNIPGKLVDMMADPARSRLYILRQDRNLVLVYDMATLQLLASLRTGNTPVGMSMTVDGQFLMVGADNSQYAAVFDLNNLVASTPILFPFGHYPRTLGVSQSNIFATARLATAEKDLLDQVDFPNRIAARPSSLGIYKNELTSSNGALAESADHDVLLLALPDGNVMEYDTSPQTWVASRKDVDALGGAYGLLADNIFLASSHILDAALVPVSELPAADGAPSGVALLGGTGLRTTAQSPSGPGLIERFDLATFQPSKRIAMAEAPLTHDSLVTPPVGQIGESILPFTRTLAVSPDQSKVFGLTISGLTVLSSNFDAPTPPPTVSSVVNSADFTAAVAPGGLVQINGGGFAQGPASATTIPLPTELGNVCATVNNIALPLFSVSSSLLTAQLPFGSAGNASLVVRSPGGIGAPFLFTILPVAPAIFRNGTAGDQTGLPVIVRDDTNELVDFTNPLHPRLPITIYLTGLGPTSPLPALGDAAPASPPASVTTPPTVMLGAATLNVTFAGLVAGQIGIYRIDATVPDVVPIGTDVPLIITQGSFSTSVAVRVVSP